MNYLEMCNEVIALTGNTSSMTSVSGAVGDAKRICTWVRQAWNEIQQLPMDWAWMRKSFSFNTIAGQYEYTPAQCGVSDFSHWRNDSFRAYLTSAGVGNEMFLIHYDFNGFRDYYLLGARKLVQARPTAVAISPSKSLLFGLIPNDVYTVSGEYFCTPQALVTDTDTPNMPSRFHMAIVHKAMVKHGVYVAAGEIIQEQQMLCDAHLNQLMIDQAPPITCAPSLI